MLFRSIKPVGLLVPNACATYDMSGNVAEWVHDFWHGLSDYDTEDGVDPEGQPTGDGHVHRGGMWAATGIYCRNSYRRGAADWEAEDWRGFRLARTLVGDG